MKIKIMTSEGNQEFEIVGTPIIVCAGDKKYLLTESGTFRRIHGKLKKELIKIMENRQHRDIQS